MFFKRFVSEKIRTALRVNPVVYINGLRQSGKTTLVQYLLTDQEYPIKGKYISFDQINMLVAAIDNPQSFLQQSSDTLILDEVQLAPEIFRTLKLVVDNIRRNEKERANGRFILTGSADVFAFPKVADSLAGRISFQTLYPFATSESLGHTGNGLSLLWNQELGSLKFIDYPLNDMISRSTFPELINKSPEERFIWFEGFISSMLQRDARDLVQLEKINVLPQLLRFSASRAANLINEADLARNLGINPVTSKAYRNILKNLFLITDLQPWYINIGKRLSKSAKGFVSDTLLLCHLMGLEIESVSNISPHVFGHILENYVAMELLKLNSFETKKSDLMHFRSHEGIEVDFILEKPDQSVLAIEVKNSEKIHPQDFKGLRYLQSVVPERFAAGYILYNGKEVIPFGKGFWAVPMAILWQ